MDKMTKAIHLHFYFFNVRFFLVCTATLVTLVLYLFVCVSYLIFSVFGYLTLFNFCSTVGFHFGYLTQGWQNALMKRTNSL